MPSFFDPPLERRGSDSTKWGKFTGEPHDIIGAWVADMDLPSADVIIDAVKKRLDERVFGYSMAPDELTTCKLLMSSVLFRFSASA